MAHRPPFEYAPITERDFDLPNGENVAVWIIPNVEHFHLDRSERFADGPAPDVKNYSWRDYGNRVGIWRFIEIFERHDVRATVALNAQVCDEEPEIVEAGMALDWEFMGHGLSNSFSIIDHEDERAAIRAARDRIHAFTGERPAGWLGPGLVESYDTVEFLAEEGFQYVCDWCNDDQPYLMDTDPGVISIPYSIEINDIPLVIRRNCSGPQLEQAIVDQFDVFYREGAEPGNAKVMAIALHPFITGQPHRSKYLDSALEYIAGHDDVWFCTGGEIADHYYSEYVE